MESRHDLDPETLIRRFDAGDRSPELMAKLNRAAFEGFHAPWEPLPTFESPKIAVPSKGQGRLPMDCEDEDQEENEGDLNDQGLEDRPGKRPTPFSPTKSKDSTPAFASEPALCPLDSLSQALTALNCVVHLAPARSLEVDLPFDPKADNQSRMNFRAHWENKYFQVTSYGDLAFHGLGELELVRSCKAYNRRNTGMEARAIRPDKGTRLRLSLATIIPFELTRSMPALVDHLVELFRKDRYFWRHMRRNMPMDLK